MPATQPGRASRKNRFPTSLNHKLDRELFGYSMAAGAASVGVMALALPAQAQIVYTPTNQEISPRGSFSLDLNNDGIADFTLQAEFGGCGYSSHCVFQAVLINRANSSNAVVGFGFGGKRFAQGFSNLARVGPGESFGSWGYLDRCVQTRSSRNSTGSFFHGTHYLGLAFTINGQIHYAWARFRTNMQPPCNPHVTLTGYAYQTIPGEPIRAGETTNQKTSESAPPPSALQPSAATLGILALGSTGLEAWRRD